MVDMILLANTAYLLWMKEHSKYGADILDSLESIVVLFFAKASPPRSHLKYYWLVDPKHL